MAENSHANAALAETMSFFKTDQPLVFISTIKKAEDSDDVVMRITNLGANDKKVTIESFNKIGKAKLTNLIEEEIKDLQVNENVVKIELGHHSIETVKITNQ